MQPGVGYDISKQACTASLGGAGSQQSEEEASSGGVQFQKNQASQTPPGRVFSLLPETQEGDFVGLLDACMMAEGTEGRMDSASAEARPEQDPGEVAGGIEEDVQPDTFAEGSATFRGAYARRLEARVFEPANWTQVKQYLEGLDLEHLIPAIDDLGVDSLEDFGFLYREDLMEAGASKKEAEAILGCTRAELDGRPDGPAQARAGYQRPSRPIAPARPATAARLVRAPDRANRFQEGVQGFNPAPGVPCQEGVQGFNPAPGVPCQEGVQGFNPAPGVPCQEGVQGFDPAPGVPCQEGVQGFNPAPGVPCQEGVQGFDPAPGVPCQEGVQGFNPAPGVPCQEGVQGFN